MSRRTDFENALSALLSANPRSNSKGRALVSWIGEEFGLDSRCSHITEDKQIGNRIAEQFRHSPAVVVFLAEASVNIETLVKRAKDDSFNGLKTVLIVKNGLPFSVSHLLVGESNSFSEWAKTEFGIIPEELKTNAQGSTTPSPVSAASGGEFENPDILAAIRTKPFILLAGMSGTGKTRIVRQLARGCCPSGSELATDPDNPGNYECIPVRPNWHDSTGLMGYVSRIDGAKYVVTDFVRFLAKAWLYEEEGIPFFLCLDEMNLAPVEQYFAEYLSVIESRRVKDGRIVTDPLVRLADKELLETAIDSIYKEEKHKDAQKFKAFFVAQGGIPIPSNFVVMGTVNMDETTCSFPRKVLDRAMTFELNEFDIDSGLDKNPDIAPGSIPPENSKGTFTHGWQVYKADQGVCDKIKPYLVAVNDVLNGTPFKFAYRTRDEVLAYCVERMKDYGASLAIALDEATSMKVLSRIEGDEQIVRRTWLEKLQTAIADGLKALVLEGEDPPRKCADKLDEMRKRLVDTGFTSFWA